MPYKFKLCVIFLLLSISLIKLARADVCTTYKLTVPTTTITRVIYVFNCTSVNSLNPTFPTITGSPPSTFNEVDLSPNFFSVLPINQVCQFTSAYAINLSYNQLTSLTNAFVLLSCITGIQSLDFSYNQIITPLVSTDFSDSLAATLIYLNLNNNRIAYIQTQTFIKSDGTSRFPSLVYLGLANNQLVAFDLLWPLSLSNPVLEVDLKNNPINQLVNQLGKSFTDTPFSTAMTGFRFVDVTNNSITSISDWNLLIYGISTATQFQTFLAKIQNYDFRNTARTPSLYCYCPPGGLSTNTWFLTFYQSISLTPSIYQLYCTNMNGMNIFTFSCPASGTATTTASGSTNAGQLVGGSSNSSSSNLYWLFLLLLIPILLILLLLLICCCCRDCQVSTLGCCSWHICSCLQPENNTEAELSGKIYDASICYNAEGENWVDDEFIPLISNTKLDYKLNKFTINDRKSKEIEKELVLSRRVILIFTNRFRDFEWENKRFKEILTRACINDPHSVLIVINRSNLTDQTVKSMFFNLLLQSKLDADNTDIKATKQREAEGSSNARSKLGLWCLRFKHKVEARTNHALALHDVEVINWKTTDFWKQFIYVMPRVKEDPTKAMEMQRSPSPPPTPPEPKPEPKRLIRMAPTKKKPRTPSPEPVPEPELSPIPSPEPEPVNYVPNKKRNTVTISAEPEEPKYIIKEVPVYVKPEQHAQPILPNIYGCNCRRDDCLNCAAQQQQQKSPRRHRRRHRHRHRSKSTNKDDADHKKRQASP